MPIYRSGQGVQSQESVDVDDVVEGSRRSGDCRVGPAFRRRSKAQTNVGNRMRTRLLESSGRTSGEFRSHDFAAACKDRGYAVVVRREGECPWPRVGKHIGRGQ